MTRGEGHLKVSKPGFSLNSRSIAIRYLVWRACLSGPSLPWQEAADQNDVDSVSIILGRRVAAGKSNDKNIEHGEERRQEVSGRVRKNT